MQSDRWLNLANPEAHNIRIDIVAPLPSQLSNETRNFTGCNV